MRIAYNALLLDRGEYSGVHVTIRELLRALVRTRGTGDGLVVYARRGIPAALDLPTVPDDPEAVRYVAPGLPMRWRAMRIVWEQFRLPGRVFADRAEVLHGPGYVVPRLCVAPMVATVHDVFALVAPQFCTAANRSHFRRMLPPTLARARRVAVPTAAVRRDLLRWAAANAREHPPAGGAPEPAGLHGKRLGAGRWAIDPEDLERKTRVIPWGVSPEWRPATAAERAAALERHGLAGPFFLAVARPEPKKNLSVALGAWFAAAAARNLPHRLVLTGPKGWGVDKALREAAANLGADDRVRFLGFVPDDELRALYSAADGLLMPSWSEGFGLPAVEAMACGCPVLASEIPALVEVAGREHALFARPDDLPAWREGIETLALDEAARRRLSAAGPARARAFDWDDTARAYWALYREALAT